MRLRTSSKSSYPPSTRQPLPDKLNQRCIDGICQPIGCTDLTCEDDQICVDENCVDDPCTNVECPDDGRCIDGQCQRNPCDGIQCPLGQVCVVVQGQAQCQLEPLDALPPGAMPGRDAGPTPGSDSGPDGQDASPLIFESDAFLPPPPAVDAGLVSGSGPNGDGATGCTCRSTEGSGPTPWLVLCILLCLRYRPRR